MSDVRSFIEELPPADVVRRELSRNMREQRLLKQILKLSEQREKVREVSGSPNAQHGQEVPA